MFPQRKGDVVKHAQVCKQGTKLKQHAHAATRRVQGFLTEVRHVLAVKYHLSAVGFLLTANKPQHRGFTATRRSHERGHFAARHRQAELTQDDAVAAGARVGKGNVLEFNQGGNIGLGHWLSVFCDK